MTPRGSVSRLLASCRMYCMTTVCLATRSKRARFWKEKRNRDKNKRIFSRGKKKERSQREGEIRHEKKVFSKRRWTHAEKKKQLLQEGLEKATNI